MEKERGRKRGGEREGEKQWEGGKRRWGGEQERTVKAGADPKIEEGGEHRVGVGEDIRRAQRAHLFCAYNEQSSNCRGGWGPSAKRRTRGGEMLPTLAGGWQASALRGEEAGRFREVAGVSIVAAGGPSLR